MTASVPMQIGSLFSGAGGLDLAAEMVFGGRVVWQAEIDPAAAKVLAHRFPGIPNLGDITEVDWSTVDQVDVLCGGFPCFPAGTLIDAGEDGLRPIETLRVGDMVLTHERRRRAVTSVMRVAHCTTSSRLPRSRSTKLWRARWSAASCGLPSARTSRAMASRWGAARS